MQVYDENLGVSDTLGFAMADFRATASFGKRQELIAMGGLLRQGFDVYSTMVDDQQIDCIVRLPGDPPVYVDIQIKARSKSAKQPGTFAAMEIRKPRGNFFFLFYSEAADCYWIMPSLELVHLASRNKSGKYAGRYTIVFTNKPASGRVQPLPKWSRYENNFDLLREARPPTA